MNRFARRASLEAGYALAPLSPPWNKKSASLHKLCVYSDWIKSKTSDGSIVILDDGSTWKVDSFDRFDSRFWSKFDNVVVDDCDSALIKYRYRRKSKCHPNRLAFSSGGESVVAPVTALSFRPKSWPAIVRPPGGAPSPWRDYRAARKRKLAGVPGEQKSLRSLQPAADSPPVNRALECWCCQRRGPL